MDAWDALARQLDLAQVGSGPTWFERHVLAERAQAERLAARTAGRVCTISLWGSKWWCHEGFRTVQPVGYLVGRRVPDGFRRRMPEPE